MITMKFSNIQAVGDLTFQTGYENYSQWRIKDILKEVGFRLEPVYVGYKAFRYRPCQRYWVVNILTGERVGNSYNGFSLEDLRYALARCGYSLHSQIYNSTRDKDGRRTSCKEFLELVESLPDEKEDLI